MQKQLRGKELSNNVKQNERIKPERLFKEEQEPIKKINQIYIPKHSKQITRQNIKLNDEESGEE